MHEDGPAPIAAALQQGRLWTPWRAAYVGQPQPPGCFLCRIAEAAPGDDESNLVLLREPDAYLVLNRFPYNPGHLLVAPRLHTGDFASLPQATLLALFSLGQRATRVLAEAYRPQGFNIGLNVGLAAGAGVPDHLHMHLVPRWNGDTNFMTVTAETRVLPELLADTYKKLLPYFAPLPAEES